MHLEEVVHNNIQVSLALAGQGGCPGFLDFFGHDCPTILHYFGLIPLIEVYHESVQNYMEQNNKKWDFNRDYLRLDRHPSLCSMITAGSSLSSDSSVMKAGAPILD